MDPEVNYRIAYHRLHVASTDFGPMLLILVSENVNGSGKNILQTLSDLSRNYVLEDPARVDFIPSRNRVYIWPTTPTSVYKGDQVTSKYQHSGA
jgi:hypothetical protein